MQTITRITLALLLVSVPAGRAAAQHDHHGGPMTDSAAVAAAVMKYHDALAGGDSAAALALLADDVVILEGGVVETREEYRRQHLPADIRGARAARAERSPIRVRVSGDVAWASSTSSTQRTTNGTTTRSAGAELMVLVRAGQEWKIAAIHWSSSRRPG